MIKAIENYQVEGIQTTLPFGTFVCEHDAFKSGHFDTHFVKKYYSPEAINAKHENEAKIAAYLAVKQYVEDQKLLRVPLK
jgi:acetyl/propionyl-CoA carboxylase alpha subunit